MLQTLAQKIAQDIVEWKKNDYQSDYAEIAEILNYQFIDNTKTNLRLLRTPQYEALTTYLYLRFIKKTNNIIDLYKAYYRNDNDLLKALDINLEGELINIFGKGGTDAIFDAIKEDNDLVKKYKLENLRETLSLDYPSYIFALVMGAGKTLLIGTIVFIEFALSLITKNKVFLKNALIFCPGKTILGSLREISEIDLAEILPPRYEKIVSANLKITYTSDKQKNITIIKSSNYNIIITNIEKIRILYKKLKFQYLTKKIDEKKHIANSRLQTLAKLNNLAVFSDEAHNTYGQQLDKEIKKVRQTINYLAQETTLMVVVNTTGTPYFKKQILKDVVFWYGLLSGIEDNILKDVRGNIYSYEEINNENFIAQVLDDFFADYKDYVIDGNTAKIALYFPKIADVEAVKPFIEKRILKYGLATNAVFSINSKSSDTDKDIFINRINDKNLPYRIFLLVGMGKEGWNCPSLFACCLARDLGNSNNFVLQAATRCLRQISANNKPARIYLSQKNTKILERQLQDNYKESITKLNNAAAKFTKQKLTLVKYDEKLPKLTVNRTIKTYTKKQNIVTDIKLTKPQITNKTEVTKYKLSKEIKFTATEIKELSQQNNNHLDIITAAYQLATLYDLDYFIIYDELQKLFKDYLNKEEFIAIKHQIEKQVQNYAVQEKIVQEHLTIIKKEGFNEERDAEGKTIYTTTILVDNNKLQTLLKNKDNYPAGFGFHYNPYKFDSELEVNAFDFMSHIKKNIKDCLFIGGITDRSKTDLIFEYYDKNNTLKNYTPDFLIITKSNKFILIETKGTHLAEDFKIKKQAFSKHYKDIAFELLISDSARLTQTNKEDLIKILNE